MAPTMAPRATQAEHTAAQPDGLLTLARLRRGQGRPEEARAILCDLLQTDGLSPSHRGTALRLLGSIDRSLGELPEAAELYEEALALHRAHGPTQERLSSTITLANARKDQGRIAAARALYQRAADEARAAGEVLHERKALLGLSSVVNRLGDFDWSVELTEQVEALCDGADDGCRAEAWAFRATPLVLAGRHDAALAATARSRALERPALLRARQLDLVDALASIGRGAPAEALAVLEPHRAAGDDGPLMEEVHFTRADAALALGWVDAAEAAVAQGERCADAGSRRATRAYPLRARIARLRGDAEDERRWLERALAALEVERAAGPQGHLARYYTGPRAVEFEAYLRLLLAQGEADAAAALMAHFKARVFTEQRLRDVHLSAVQPNWSARERFLAALARVEAGAPLDVDGHRQRRAQLPAHVALLDYYLLDDALVVALLHRDGVQVRTVRAGRAEIGEHVRALRVALDEGEDPWAERRWLSQVLVEPIADALDDTGARWLGVVGHGALHRLPFVLLDHRDGALLDRFAVFRGASSDDVLASLQAEPLPAPRHVVAFGDPEGDLPDGRAEARMVVRRFEGDDAVLGEHVTEGAAREALSSADLVHFATHAEQAVPGQDAWLRLAPDTADDGRLTAAELAEVPVAARLVALFGCDTGVGVAVGAGDEILGALDRALLSAGARTVVSTRWPVRDAAALDVAHDFYQALAEGAPTVEALAVAQRALRDRSAACVDAPRPSPTRCAPTRGVRPCPTTDAMRTDWAAFALVGDPR
ncbi:MAG: CHAT domain-containing protein [Myxococcales bacterium]|nr:CHAT domain-containing protein [Myxococcales bacterium]